MSSSVLHVVPAIAPRYGGPSAVTLGTCRALQRAGHATVVATTDADGRGRLPVPLQRIELHAGVPVIFFRRRLGEGFKYAAGLDTWLRRRVREFDLVHIHAVLSHASFAAGRACRHARVPYIVRPLGTLAPWSLGRKALRKRLALRLAGDRLLDGAAVMHYTTAEEMRLAESCLRLPRGVVVPLGVDDALFTGREAAAEEPYLLSLGRLDPKKGVDLLILAFHDMVRADAWRGWKLVIAGGGNEGYVSRLRALADAGPGQSSISFTGWVAGDAKNELIRRAGLFVLPSLQENFGLAVAEAMACGVPVVVTTGVDLAQEIAAAGAGWVIDRDVIALSGALSSAIAHDAERLARGENGRRLAEKFRWTAVADRLADVYRDVIAAYGAASPRAAQPAWLGPRAT